MRIMVTGGLGVNGAFVTRLLVQKGMDVVVFDASGDRSLLGGDVDRIVVEAGDVRDPDSVRGAMSAHDVDRVIHLAALLTPAAQADPLLALDVNVMGMRNVMVAAEQEGVDRVVFASSKAAYGPLLCSHGAPQYTPVTEEHPSKPRNFYDYTKIMCEGIGSTLGQQNGIAFAALRFATIYGPGRMVRHQSRLLHSRLIESALAGIPFAADAPGGGDLDDLIYVGDAADALVAAVTTDRLRHDVYNIGSGQLNSLVTLAEAVRQVCPSASLEINPSTSETTAYASRFDCTRAKEDLGFVATDLAESVRHYRDALQVLGPTLQATAESQR
ncbi:NAD(P)-dependent oxidoreductase [Blastococcus sp. CT_GayMR20]|uniref:NAD-dependent epimerase/dehydratase family protein n=1 Tax=Blastococcus sp. CT_GayMR20 TaxID=2559609 RepID=UPI001FD74B21|nr:NAD(P)-dependent oxidoreductase [Blastococcus sp. CT_GayMR20]